MFPCPWSPCAMPISAMVRKRGFPHLRHIGFHAFARGKCGAAICRSAHGFRKNRIRLVLTRPDDHVIGLRHCNTELVNRHRTHVLSIRLDDGHFQTGNSDVEIRHGGGVDNAKADPFARLEDPRPILRSTLTVNERRETLQVLNIRRGHPHFAPCLAVGGGVVEAHLFRCRERNRRSFVAGDCSNPPSSSGSA